MATAAETLARHIDDALQEMKWWPDARTRQPARLARLVTAIEGSVELARAATLLEEDQE